jgi:hypothetical protein
MPLSIAKVQAISDLAQHLYEYLPGTPHPMADARISFAGAAGRCGLETYWLGGSKLPAITQLLMQTLERQPKRFCGLILEIVRSSIVYRASKNPLQPGDIETLHALVYRVGFRLRDLENTEAFGDLAVTYRPAKGLVSSGELSASERSRLRVRLGELAEMSASPRGFAFEQYLNELFSLSAMTPRSPFRLKGEQIDGSFEAGNQTYLLEAKWESKKTGQADLLVFSGKIGGKAQWARGLFVSFAGFTTEGMESFARGRSTNLVCMDRFDIYFVLNGRATLLEVLTRKLRRAAEENVAFVPAQELFD